MACVAAIIILSGCRSEEVRRIQDSYKIGTVHSELNLETDRILLDLEHPSNRAVPLIIGMRGYEFPERPLLNGERLVVVAEDEVDLVSYLFFCADGTLCAIEVLGS